MEKNTVALPNPLVSTGVEKMILVIRGKQVLLDRDLATLYGVETRRINEQVKRNIERFPEDFCFQLDKNEFENWKLQFAISNSADENQNLKSQMGMRTNSWTQLEDASCHTRKNRRQKPWKSFTT